MKRVVTIQDISCIGRCSLTVALPIISAMGVETAIIPTAVLSTHTSFQGFTFHDLTQEIMPIADHWREENMEFDAIYTGYLGSFEQIDIMGKFFDLFKTPSNLIVVDPVMADNGRLYTGFDEQFVQAMAGLCGKADIIVPNITEAAFLVGMEYRTVYDEDYIRALLQGLIRLGCKKAVITGVSLESSRTGIMGLDSGTGEYFSYYHDKINENYHGTGDVFSSTFVGALMNGKDILTALTIAAEFTVASIRTTMSNPDKRWYGVDFEIMIPKLAEYLAE